MLLSVDRKAFEKAENALVCSKTFWLGRIMKPAEKPNVLLPHGGYKKLRSYKVAEAVYDATAVFCRRFYAQDRRMTDQMVQAARSGVRKHQRRQWHRRDLPQKRNETHKCCAGEPQ